MSGLTSFLYLLATLAQTPAPKPGLDGTVLNSLTGQPIPNAAIQLTRILTLDLGVGVGLGWMSPLTSDHEKAATRVHIDPHGDHEVQIRLYRPPQ